MLAMYINFTFVLEHNEMSTLQYLGQLDHVIMELMWKQG